MSNLSGVKTVTPLTIAEQGILPSSNQSFFKQVLNYVFALGCGPGPSCVVSLLLGAGQVQI